MYQYKGLDDTIAAIATAVGQGGIGMIRLSGDKAVAIVAALFKQGASGRQADLKSHHVHYGWIVDGDTPVDEVLVTVMRAPKSYTREDVVEISCHGGVASLKRILTLVLDRGARLAEPGEFTKRAFLNGRIDLAQAEAVLDIVQAKTNAFLQVSTHQLKGDLSLELEAIRQALMRIYTELEAVVNFPEDDIDSKGRAKIEQDLEKARKHIDTLLASGEHGRILKEGIRIVICGKPNVGKSSLLNVLLKEPRAIVSDIAGTTRDTIEEKAQIKGIPFELVDTAGILEPRDLIEEEAVKRSRLFMQSADLVLVVLDASRPLEKSDEDVLTRVQNQHVLVVFNKSDLPVKIDTGRVTRMLPKAARASVSAVTKEGMDGLESAIVEEVWQSKMLDTHGIMISNVRHLDALKQALAVLGRAVAMARDGSSYEFVSEDVKAAVNSLDGITGRNIDEDLLDTIFSSFCIGK